MSQEQKRIDVWAKCTYNRWDGSCLIGQIHWSEGRQLSKLVSVQTKLKRRKSKNPRVHISVPLYHWCISGCSVSVTHTCHDPLWSSCYRAHEQFHIVFEECPLVKSSIANYGFFLSVCFFAVQGLRLIQADQININFYLLILYYFTIVLTVLHFDIFSLVS